MSELSHVAPDGSVRMVDVGAKDVSARCATAEAAVRFEDPSTLSAVLAGVGPKGDALAAARLAGIMAAKRTAELIPLCHPVPLDHVSVEVELDESLPGVRIRATARCRASTGVEMEAMTAASVAALTVIDMLKSVDGWMTIENLRLCEKSGGRRGHVTRPVKSG